jgi:cytochrome c oxidase subunit 2
MQFKWWYPFPFDASKHGWEVDRLLNVLHGFMLALFIGWIVFFIYCLVKFRQRTGQKASYELIHAKPSKVAEGFVVVFEVFLLLGLSMPVWAKIKNEFPEENPADPARKPLIVRVVAQQFAWNFHYAGPDGIFGRTDITKAKAAAGNPIGLDFSDPAAKDDVVSAVFHFPIHRPVIARLTSMDVIHGFHVPMMRIQHDVLPGMEVKVWFEADKIPPPLPPAPDRTTREGNAEVVCAQLCGNSHFKMRGAVSIDTPEQFAAWLQMKQDEKNISFEDEE